jgi:Tfp pilus assembly protein PilE
MTTMTNDILSALAATRVRRDQAQARLQTAGIALERGRQIAEAATSRVRALTDDDDRRSAEFSRRLEDAAHTGEPAVPYFEIDAPAAAERHRAEMQARAATQALERLTEAHSAAAEAVRVIDEQFLAIRRHALAGRVDELTSELLELRSRELEIVGLISALGHGELGGVPLSAEATAAVSYPPARPTADNIIGSGAVADLNSPICGRRDIFARARTYWDAYLADLEARAAEAPAAITEQAAA